MQVLLSDFAKQSAAFPESTVDIIQEKVRGVPLPDASNTDDTLMSNTHTQCDALRVVENPGISYSVSIPDTRF